MRTFRYSFDGDLSHFNGSGRFGQDTEQAPTDTLISLVSVSKFKINSSFHSTLISFTKRSPPNEDDRTDQYQDDDDDLTENQLEIFHI